MINGKWVDDFAEQTAYMVTRGLLKSITLEEAINSVEEACTHLSQAGAEELAETGDLDYMDVTAAIVSGIRRGHAANMTGGTYE